MVIFTKLNDNKDTKKTHNLLRVVRLFCNTTIKTWLLHFFDIQIQYNYNY